MPTIKCMNQHYKQDLCDFIIQVESAAYHVHRDILCAQSKYFKSMSECDAKEWQSGRIKLPNVDSECIKNCIDFMYSGKLTRPIPDEKISDQLDAVIMIELDECKAAICKVLEQSLTPQNFHSMKEIAAKYDLQALLSACQSYYENQCMAISAQPGFTQEQKCDLINIFKSENLKLTAEEKLTVSLRWFQANPDENIIDLIKLIKLKDVPSEYLIDLVEKHPLVANDFGLYKLINIQLMQNIRTMNSRRQTNEKAIILFDDFSAMSLYDPKANDVTPFHDEHLMDVCGSYTPVVLGSYIFLLHSRTREVYRFNYIEKNSSWEKMQNMIISHGCFPPAVVHSGSIFCIGTGTDTPAKTVERYDPSANRWFKLQYKPDPISFPTLVSLNNSIYCIGGHDAEHIEQSICRFTPSTSQWIDLAPMRTPRMRCGAVAVGQVIFVVAGEGERCLGNEVESYNVALDQWTALPPMIEHHPWCNAHYVNGWIYTVSRFNLRKMEKYNIANRTWHRVQPKNAGNCFVSKSVLI